MPRSLPADDATRDRPFPWARGAVFTAALFATAAALALALGSLGWSSSAAPPPALPWMLAIGMACTAAALGWTLWRQRELSADLQRSRADAQALARLLEAWQWRGDAQHRLASLRPPANADNAAWADGAVGQALWEYFGADHAAAAALRARLTSGAPLDGLRVRRLGAQGEPLDFELRGSLQLDAGGRAAGYLGSARAVNDEDSMRGDQRLLSALLQSLPAPVFVLEGDARGPAALQRGNGAASQWLGLGQSQLAGLAWGELQARLPADLRASVTHALADPDGGAERPACSGWTVRSRRLADAPRGAEATWLLVLLPEARPDASPTVPGGDSESFSYTVSHDLRAPIRVVEGFAKILKEDYGRQLDRIGNDHIDRVLGAAARMNSMIDALLALSQLSSRPLARQTVNLSQLAGYIAEDLRRQSPERSVALSIEAGLQTQGDPTLLRVALENLLGNAWKYTAKRREAEIRFERSLHDGQPVFTVRDNGAGFDMRFADRLFGVFQRLHSANDFPGTGVGLATVRRIVQRHGGEIWAEAEVDRGSAFHFTLPSSRAAA